MAFRPCFTTPTFTTFTWLVVGFLAQPGTRTVTGMLAGVRLAGTWHHRRAHRFFAAARWSADALGLVVLEVIVAGLLTIDAPLCLVPPAACRSSRRPEFSTMRVLAHAVRLREPGFQANSRRPGSVSCAPTPGAVSLGSAPCPHPQGEGGPAAASLRSCLAREWVR